ncbi:glycosyltransferase family 2 protein [Bacteroides thetaiotaomicron]|uniref:glycosyltransferase family 2 protein n=1 Tax=Bacteroides thetaiotaomicron TaxID=818 RepID=UPI001F3BCE84|nr:glycosyltransferase family 2 protein [Bacteroides thetaiotaomicron]MCE9149195.1 glycosyltransferase family 2 protein [Bacteroides thetaiotaomicron]
MEISVVSPIYRAENIVEELVKQIIDNVEKVSPDFEIILVNDASPDKSWQKITEICKNDKRVKGINLSRNFGQHYAITAGLNFAKGEWVVVMDCDLQDRPDEIPNLYRQALEGWDSVFAQRIGRQDSFFKRMSSKCFYALFSYLTETRQDSSVANFGIYNRKVVSAILSMQDSVRYFPTMAQWVGYDKYYLPVRHSERLEGTSSYNMRRLFKLAFDNIIAFSDKPLRLVVKFGFLLSFFSLCIAFYFLVRYMLGDINVIGFASLIVSIWFLSGMIVMLIGIVGIYIGKVFDNTKKRPVFIVKEELNVCQSNA